jgi:hypothetical protein
MTVDHRLVKVVVVAVVGFAAPLALSCGGGSPSSSTPPTTVPATPTPTPPIGLPDVYYQANCPLGKGDINAICTRTHSELLADLEGAMSTLIQAKPEIFDLTNEYAPGTRAYKVLDREAYMNGLVMALRAQGLCAERDPDDPGQQTVRAKNSADFSENFDVILSSGHMRRGNGAYRQTCNPSSFPVERSEDAPPFGSGCFRPYPPKVSRFKCKVHLKGMPATFDSTPLVGPDPAYCTSVGFVGQAICPIRPEGAVDRKACENWRVGNAKDTGRPGPTWTKADGTYCTGPESGCENHPDNQYQLLGYHSGTYFVSGRTGDSCKVTF